MDPDLYLRFTVDEDSVNYMKHYVEFIVSRSLLFPPLPTSLGILFDIPKYSLMFALPSNLKSLTLPNVADPHDYDLIYSTLPPLETLEIFHGDNIVEIDLESLLVNQTSLKGLQLHDGILDYSQFMDIASFLPHLKEFTCESYFLDELFAYLPSTLTSLTVMTGDLTDEVVTTSLRSLKQLHIGQIETICGAFFTNMSSLEHLELV